LAEVDTRIRSLIEPGVSEMSRRSVREQARALLVALGAGWIVAPVAANEGCISPALTESVARHQQMGSEYAAVSRQQRADCATPASRAANRAQCEEHVRRLTELQKSMREEVDRAHQLRIAGGACTPDGNRSAGPTPAEREAARAAGFNLPPGARVTEMIAPPTAADFLPVPRVTPGDDRRGCQGGGNAVASFQQAHREGYVILQEWGHKRLGIPQTCGANWPFLIAKWQETTGAPVSGAFSAADRERLRAEVTRAERELDRQQLAVQGGKSLPLEAIDPATRLKELLDRLPTELCWHHQGAVRCSWDAACADSANAVRASRPGRERDEALAEQRACQLMAKYRGSTPSRFDFGGQRVETARLQFDGERIAAMAISVDRGSNASLADAITRQLGAPQVEQVQFVRQKQVGTREVEIETVNSFGTRVGPSRVEVYPILVPEPYTMPRRIWSTPTRRAEEVLDEVGNPTGRFDFRYPQ
jgi:hypothetical protein